jgi:hypothetical protein
MSKYKVIATEFRTFASLKQALSDLGVECEIAASPKSNTLHLYGYTGDKRPETAAIAIRRATVNRYSGGSSNDIGFAWNGQAYEAIVSDFDGSRPGVTKMLGELKQRYAVHEIKKQAHAKGYTLREQTQPDGTLRLTLVHR